MLKKYRLTCMRTYRDDRGQTSKRTKREYHVIFKAFTDKEAMNYVVEWFRKRRTESGVYRRYIGVSYKFLRLEQVRDISKRCARKLREGLENEKR